MVEVIISSPTSLDIAVSIYACSHWYRVHNCSL